MDIDIPKVLINSTLLLYRLENVYTNFNALSNIVIISKELILEGILRGFYLPIYTVEP